MRLQALAPVVAAAGLLLAAVAPPLAGQSDAFGVTPATITLDDAQAGQSYVYTVTVQNQLSSASTITIDREGDPGAWATTDPSSGFTMPSRTNRDVKLTIQVPAGTGPGQRTGQLTFTTEPKSSGSGSSVRLAAAVVLDVTVGGTAIIQVAWSAASAQDTDNSTPPQGTVNATNAGNVATTARMSATVTSLEGSEVLARGNGSLLLRPGETGAVPVVFTTALPVGQYVMHFQSVEPAGHSDTMPFKVTAPGEIPPRGTLLAIQHAPFGTAGSPLRIDGTFRNDGTVAIRAAQLRAEVKRSGELLAPLQSDALAVPPGATVNLTVYWTPPAGGTYELTGHVVYDGYLTAESSSPLNVNAAPGGGGIPWWVWLLLAVLLAAAGATAFLLRPKGKPKARPKAPAPRDAREPQPWQRRKG